VAEIADQAKVEPQPAKPSTDAAPEKSETAGQVKDAKATGLTDQKPETKKPS
jgi:hypothetical protein